MLLIEERTGVLWEWWCQRLEMSLLEEVGDLVPDLTDRTGGACR